MKPKNASKVFSKDRRITGEKQMNRSKEMAGLAVRALEDKKAADVKVLDIAAISTLADYFIIASGANRNQVQAMADNAEEILGRAGYHARGVEGYRNGNWILLDFGDIVIHLFDQANREFFSIDRLWRDGKEVDLHDLPDAAAAAEE